MAAPRDREAQSRRAQVRKAYGQRLAEVMKERGFTSTSLAKKTESLGVPRSTISKFVHGERLPNGDHLAVMANAMGVPTAKLVPPGMGGQYEPEDVDEHTPAAESAPEPHQRASARSVSDRTDSFPAPLRRYLEKHRDHLTPREQHFLADFAALHDPDEARDEEFYDELVEAHRKAIRRLRERSRGSSSS
ncbi:MAG: helix-turn-helix domain-containing protein [Myxococcales bacterium]